MEFDEILERRFTTRSFSDEEVSVNDLMEIIKSANHTPVAYDMYNLFKLFIITGRELRSGRELVLGTPPYRDMTYGCTAFISIGFCGRRMVIERAYESAGCIAYGLMLETINHGLEATIVDDTFDLYYNSKAVKRYWRFGDYIPILSVCIGHPKYARTTCSVHEIPYIYVTPFK